MDTLSRKITISKLFCLLSEKRSILRGKNLSARVDPFSEEVWWVRPNRKLKKLSPFLKLQKICQVYQVPLRGMDTLSGETTINMFSDSPACHLKIVCTLKGKNLLPLGANSLLLKHTPFQKRLSV